MITEQGAQPLPAFGPRHPRHFARSSQFLKIAYQIMGFVEILWNACVRSQNIVNLAFACGEIGFRHNKQGVKAAQLPLGVTPIKRGKHDKLGLDARTGPGIDETLERRPFDE
jgi:hypothetical protein